MGNIDDQTQPINVAIIGLGTVGTGVAKILLEESKRIHRQAGRHVRLKRVVVRDLAKSREVSLPDGVLSDNIDDVVNDSSIDVAIQLMGGIQPAHDVMIRLLESGKNIVTANKALLYEHGPKLIQLARDKGQTIAFEAAVAGGIPIIATVTQSLTANQVLSIEAILNGTSNFILTQMWNEKRSYAEALSQAQELGYAEADPAMDVDGTDAAQKLSILAQLCFGIRAQLSGFTVTGIEAIELSDLTYAAELGYAIKLLAVAKEANGQLEMHVQPTLVRAERPLAHVDGPSNMIEIDGDVVGRTWYSGPGAGQMATASAVVADLIDTVLGRTSLTFSQLSYLVDNEKLEICPVDKIENRYYLRFEVEDRPHVFADIADILGRYEISLASIIQHEARPQEQSSSSTQPTTVPVVVMTHRTELGKILSAEKELASLPSMQSPCRRLPVAD